MPAASTATTLKVYVPSGCPERSYVPPDEHVESADTTVAPRSSSHLNVAPGSSENSHDARAALPGLGGDSSIEGAAGGVVSST